MKDGDAIRILWNTEHYFLFELRLTHYTLFTEPGVVDAWLKGRQN